jgi:hypothetical protein
MRPIHRRAILILNNSLLALLASLTSKFCRMVHTRGSFNYLAEGG